MREVFALIVCRTDVRRARVAVITVVMLIAAGWVLNRDALPDRAAAPYEAGSCTVWVGSAGVDQSLRRVARLAARGLLGLHTLLVEAGIQCAWDAIVAVGGFIAAAGDLLVMTLVAGGACIGGADIIVFTVLVG